MEQQTLSNLATPAGREAYQALWHDLLIEQRNSTLPSLWQLWRTAARGTSFTLVGEGRSYRVAHSLGLRGGTRLFMEEIVVRHYFNNVQALVYLGAVLLLVFLGLRFAGLLTEEVALIGLGIEALMLLALFVVLFYSPEEGDVHVEPVERAAPREDNDHEVIREVLGELEEIGGTYASLGMKLERLAESQERGMQELRERVEQIRGLDMLESHAERLETTNEILNRLVATMESLNDKVEMLVGKELEYHVRRELERRIAGTFANGTLEAPTDNEENAARPGTARHEGARHEGTANR